MYVSRNKKGKKIAYLPGYWLDLAQIWCRGVFLDSKYKINNKIFCRKNNVQMIFEDSEKNRLVKTLDILFIEKLQITYMFQFKMQIQITN